jgi:hypothetical protein
LRESHRIVYKLSGQSGSKKLSPILTDRKDINPSALKALEQDRDKWQQKASAAEAELRALQAKAMMMKAHIKRFPKVGAKPWID